MINKENNFDVIVVGGGHAGIEAAHISAKMGSRTLLITPHIDQIGMMPCNPSIGGIGKGHLVFEVSALGGLMPKLCSKTYLQARMLNSTRGPAVQGLRLQIDKFSYSKMAKKHLESMENTTVFQGSAADLLLKNSSVQGITTECGKIFHSKSVVITTGTFLSGVIRIGDKTIFHRGSEGPTSQMLSNSIAKILETKLGRLKTGTPPRILRSSVDFTKLEVQIPDQLDYLFEFNPIDVKHSHECFIAHTNEKTHEIIKKNLKRSALFGGFIEGVGPRYCPSIEDKIHRFPDKKSHHVFVEPEGTDSDEIYPSGLSTSLPIDVQEAYMRSMAGFENCVITKPGYAVEYDFLQPTHLKHSLECKNVPGLFFAGQVNGTTGYEEAAAQGIIAGINASLSANDKDNFTLSRTEGYIGVMIDDLVTIGVDEPYRMFTSRAERRLLLRQDNAFERLMPKAKEFEIIDNILFSKFEKESFSVKKLEKYLRKKWGKTDLFKALFASPFTPEAKEKARIIAQEILGTTKVSGRAVMILHAKVRYEGYLQMEEREAQKTVKFSAMKIPDNFKYNGMSGLSIELQQKLKKIRPGTIAQAQLIPGMTPAATSLLIFKVKNTQAN
ncbi:tRNA uridine-5-carboxymethylaminomethyl(34) synthesis enzyme MnmG [Candidatus Dependentiae bacterium]